MTAMECAKSTINELLKSNEKNEGTHCSCVVIQSAMTSQNESTVMLVLLDGTSGTFGVSSIVDGLMTELPFGSFGFVETVLF